MENYQPKVEQVERYSDSQGEHLVCRGKLILLEPEKCEPLTLSGGHKYKKLKPIIISEIEEIKFHDIVFGKNDNSFFHWKESQHNIDYSRFSKVLAIPKQFSDKHLQAIVDGKIKFGDEVLVKCQAMSTVDVEGKGDGGLFLDYNQIALDQQNHIALFPAKQSLEEVAEEYALSFSKDGGWDDNMHDIEAAFKSGAEWAKKNLS